MQWRVKSAVATGCDGDVELITESFQVDRLILRLDVVSIFFIFVIIFFHYKSDGVQLRCNERDASRFL